MTKFIHLQDQELLQYLKSAQTAADKHCFIYGIGGGGGGSR